MCLIAMLEGGPLEGEGIPVHLPPPPYIKIHAITSDGGRPYWYTYAGQMDADFCVYRHMAPDLDSPYYVPEATKQP